MGLPLPLVGVLGVGCLTAGLIGGSVLALGSSLLLLPVSPRLYRAATSFILSAWGYFICGITERIYGVTYVFSGEPLPSGGRVLLVANHRTRLDWLFLWTAALKASLSNGIRIILKAGLKNVPFFGWALQQFDFLFIARRLDTDQQHMTSMMKMYGEGMKDYMMLLFPEGTDLSKSNLEKSAKFAADNKLQPYQFVLHPRTKGFWVCLQSLGSSLDSVYDVTVAYHPTVPSRESVMFNGKTPRECHIHVVRYSIADVPQDSEEAAAAWLNRRFAEKEDRLKAFYRDGTFGESASPRAYRLSSARVYGSMAFFLGLFAVLVWMSLTHFWWFAAVMAAYFGTFYGFKKLHGGIDMYMLKNWGSSDRVPTAARRE